MSGASAKRKGARRELQTIAALTKGGWLCTKAGGSLGIFDVIALRNESYRAIQVKSNKPPPPVERKAIEDAPIARNAKEIWVWKDHRGYEVYHLWPDHHWRTASGVPMLKRITR